MTTKMNLQGTTRKTLVNAIAEITGEKAIYRAMPTSNYDIGEITVTRDGSIICPDDSDIITGSVALVKIFEKTAEICGNPKDASNWILTDLLKIANDSGKPVEDLDFRIESVGEVIKLVNDGKINRKTGKQVLSKVVEENVIPEEYVEKNGLAQVSDLSSIEPVIKEVLAANEKAVNEYLAGNEKNFQFLIGQSMRSLKGKADPQAVRTCLQKLLDELR